MQANNKMQAKKHQEIQHQRVNYNYKIKLFSPGKPIIFYL